MGRLDQRGAARKQALINRATYLASAIWRVTCIVLFFFLMTCATCRFACLSGQKNFSISSFCAPFFIVRFCNCGENKCTKMSKICENYLFKEQWLCSCHPNISHKFLSNRLFKTQDESRMSKSMTKQTTLDYGGSV